MSGKVLEIQSLIGRERLATEIANKYESWNSRRDDWLQEKNELRDYIFATDTTKTTNKKLPWKNSTTIPKLCQIRDNLIANYMTALFPNEQWLRWEAYDKSSDTLKKKKAIVAYISNKVRESDFFMEVAKLVDDYVTYGNAQGEVVYVNEIHVDEDTGEEVPGYIGPRLVRLSPYDLVYNPTAPTFDESPKVVRYLKTLGELKADVEDYPEMGYYKEALEKAQRIRGEITAYRSSDVYKASSFMVDGFGDLAEYYQSGYVEVLKFLGDIHDIESGKLRRNREIIIIDKSYVIYDEPIRSWDKKSNMIHVAWRDRPDNLYGMGPLDNLVGMQYRIDHLENLKADVFDLIAHPPLKIRGNVEEFEWGPESKIFLGDDGDVEMLRPDTTALNADTQIAILENKMEEMAGAPRQAMGIRTPGEKTAFEVQSLENASSRIFQHKITKFEIAILEKALNLFLEASRRNLNGPDLVRVMDDDLGVAEFIQITKEDITAKGKIRPIGARHFAARAQLAQNLLGIFNSQIGAMLIQHTSKKNLAVMVEDLFGLERYGLFKSNVGLVEDAESQQLANQLSEDTELAGMTGPEELE